MNLEQIPAELILFFMFYGGTALAALIACVYLCVRQGNAFAADITPPARQLARVSGYRSYSTFSLAFKQRMGQSVTAWMRETPK